MASDLEERLAAIRQALLSGGGELKKIINDFGLYQEKRNVHSEKEIVDLMRKIISISMELVDNTRSRDTRTALSASVMGRRTRR